MQLQKTTHIRVFSGYYLVPGEPAPARDGGGSPFSVTAVPRDDARGGHHAGALVVSGGWRGRTFLSFVGCWVSVRVALVISRPGQETAGDAALDPGTAEVCPPELRKERKHFLWKINDGVC